MQSLKLFGALVALAVSSASASAAPVKMSDQKLDTITAGSADYATDVTIICSFGSNCSGNDGAFNGGAVDALNAAEALNIVNGALAGSAVLGGYSIDLPLILTGVIY